MTRGFISKACHVMMVLSLISLQGFISFGGANYVLGSLV